MSNNIWMAPKLAFRKTALAAKYADHWLLGGILGCQCFYKFGMDTITDVVRVNMI